jgi:hypothetical protein
MWRISGSFPTLPIKITLLTPDIFSKILVHQGL